MLTDCIFCRIVKGTSPAEIIYEDEHTMAFLDITPDRPGHTLVVSKTHTKDLLETSDVDLGHMMTTVKKIAPAIVEGVKAQGFNVGMNNGAAAGQIINHAHIHIIPRSQGDGLEMWSGESYETDDEMRACADDIRSVLAVMLLR